MAIFDINLELNSIYDLYDIILSYVSWSLITVDELSEWNSAYGADKRKYSFRKNGKKRAYRNSASVMAHSYMSHCVYESQPELTHSYRNHHEVC